MIRLLFVGLLTGLWLSVEEAHCQNLEKDVNTTTLCYNTSSGNICFTTFIAKDNQPVRKPFEAARHLCSSTVPGSSLLRINSLEGQRTAEIFIRSQELENETIVIDAQRLSATHSAEWSWVNGHPTVPKDISKETTLLGIDAACVESKHKQSPIYCTGTQLSLYRYICEHSDAKPAFASNESATWYDARNECLRLGGDLASITDLNMIGSGSWLKEDEKHWIGLHRNKWIWKSTGTALTYTNWKGGYRDEVSHSKCICIDQQCRQEYNGTSCEDDSKWNTCSCDQNNYAVVCQKDENSHVTTTENVVTEGILQSTSRPTTRRNRRTNSIKTTSATTPVTTAISTETSIATAPSRTITSTENSIDTTESATTKPTKTTNATTPVTTTTSTETFMATNPVTTTSFTKTSIATTPITTTTSTKTAITTGSSTVAASTETPSTGLLLFQSFGHKEILIGVLLLVAVVFIVVAVVVVIRKRKRDKRNETSPTENTNQEETVTSVYATVVPGNKPPEVTTPAASPTYAEVQMTQNPKPSSNPNTEVTPNPTPSNITYAEVQMTQQPTPSNTTYAEVQMTQQPAPSNTTYADVTPNPTPSNITYAEVTKQPEPSNNHIYANYQPTTNEAAEMDRGVVYAGLDFSHPNGKAVEEPIYLQAMDVKPEAGSGEDDVATQDLGPVYAESMKPKKSD